jgi:release factor glutamine methyltransferase
MTIKDIVLKYKENLKDITNIPSKEIEVLMGYILNKDIVWLHTNYNKVFSKEKELIKLIEKRSSGYPLEYILSKVSFYGYDFFINENVLIPRPETELLIDNAVKILKDIQSPKVIEIGVGSGVISILLALLIQDIKIVAIDINEDALKLAKKNAIKFKVDKNIEFIKSDLYHNINNIYFDMSISNPPYISNSYNLPLSVKYEPKNALFGGNRGDEILTNIINETYKRKIKYLCCEMGYDQKEYIIDTLKNFNIEKINFYQDYSSFNRGFYLEFKY